MSLDSFIDLLASNRPPTDSEIAQLNTCIADSNRELSFLSQDITKLKAQLQILCDKEAALLQRVATCHTALSPFRRVPEDVVQEIFVACLETERYPTMSNQEAPVLLTHISSGLRRIALSTPALWTSVHIPIFGRFPAYLEDASRDVMAKRVEGVREWLLRRSGDLPLSIAIYEIPRANAGLKEDSLDRDFIDVILSCSLRWRDVSFSVTPVSLLGVTAALAPSDVPLLRSLSFNLYPSTFVHDPFGPGWNTLKLLGARNLNRFDLFNSNAAEDYILSDCPLNWSSLTHFTFHTKDLDAYATHITEVLRETPLLVSLDINVATTFHADLDFDYVNRISLPCLKVLAVTETFEETSAGILKALSAPALETLSYGMTDEASLLAVVEDSESNIHELSLMDEISFDTLHQCLGRCPDLTILRLESISESHGYTGPIPMDDEYEYRRNTRSSTTIFLEYLVLFDQTQCLCPHLQYLRCDSALEIFPETLRLLLRRKNGDAESLDRWKGVMMEIRCDDEDEYEEFDGLRSMESGTGMRLDLTLHSVPNELDHSLHAGLIDRSDASWWPSGVTEPIMVHPY